MKRNRNQLKSLAVIGAMLAAGGSPSQAQSSELDALKSAMQTMQKNMAEMQQKIEQLEREKAMGSETSTNVAAASPSMQTVEKVAAGQDVGQASPVNQRPALNDNQEAAPRPNDLTLDPKYRGFIPVPNTPVLVKFNAKPHLDLTYDDKNSGNPDRFVPAQIPVQGEAAYGGSARFNINARASQLSVDVRAPDMPGNFRFYYQNDFFGSGSGMAYRLQQLYGQFYNVTAGFTYSCFEDPDAWPDTVDYEGPNAVMFARRPLVRYALPLCDQWQMNFGVEAPGSEVDANSTASSISSVNRAPDGTMNVRWENAKWGHVQLGGVLRDIGASGPTAPNESVFGWGLNLASSINVFQNDSIQEQLTYGEGIFRYFNDDFMNNDAAYNSSGHLEALPTFGAMIAYTHRWNESFRSTASYGFVSIDNLSTQGPNAYHQTHYGSLNLIWQLRKHLSVGVEALYGKKEEQSGATGDVWRFQIGMVYSLF